MSVIRSIEQLSGELYTITRGATTRDRLRIARILSHAHLRFGRGRRLLGWLPMGDDPARPVHFRAGQTVLARRADAIVLHEHFGLDVYGVHIVAKPVKIVVDLGANVGYAALALGRRYPEARFLCVEADPAIRALLTRNLQLNRLDAEILGVAVVGTAGNYTIDASRYPANRVAARENGSVEGITLPALLDRAGVEMVDLMKIDIEGSERGVFEHASEWCSRVRSIVGELHDGLTGEDAERLLAPYGYVRIALPDRERFRTLCCFARADDLAPAASDGPATPTSL